MKNSYGYKVIENIKFKQVLKQVMLTFSLFLYTIALALAVLFCVLFYFEALWIPAIMAFVGILIGVIAVGLVYEYSYTFNDGKLSIIKKAGLKRINDISFRAAEVVLIKNVDNSKLISKCIIKYGSIHNKTIVKNGLIDSNITAYPYIVTLKSGNKMLFILDLYMISLLKENGDNI